MSLFGVDRSCDHARETREHLLRLIFDSGSSIGTPSQVQYYTWPVCHGDRSCLVCYASHVQHCLHPSPSLCSFGVLDPLGRASTPAHRTFRAGHSPTFRGRPCLGQHHPTTRPCRSRHRRLMTPKIRFTTGPARLSWILGSFVRELRRGDGSTSPTLTPLR